MRANDSRAIQFTDCFVPDADRLGPEGLGTALLMSRPPYVTLGLAANSVGIAQAALDLATAHAQARTGIVNLLKIASEAFLLRKSEDV